jgi:hypothetical protein
MMACLLQNKLILYLPCTAYFINWKQLQELKTTKMPSLEAETEVLFNLKKKKNYNESVFFQETPNH